MARFRRVRRILVAGSVILGSFTAVPGAARAADIVFGPVTCQRSTGAATRFDYSFKVAEPSRGFVVKVYNGGLEDASYELVSSSTMMLNGIQILGPSAFSQNVAYTEMPIALQADNILSVEVRGKPGGAMIIKIFPFVVLETPSEGQTFRTGPITVSGHLYAAASAVSVNGALASITGEYFVAPAVALGQGHNVLTATAIRDGGIVGSDSVDVVLDSDPPLVAIEYPGEGLITNRNVSPRYTVSDALDTNPIVNVTPEPPYVLEGSYRMTITATDRAGNAAVAVRNFTIDRTPPAITMLSPMEGETVSTPEIDVAGSVDDPAARVTVNGVEAALAAGRFMVPGVRLVVGENAIVVEALDPVGNGSTHTVHVRYAPPGANAGLVAFPEQIAAGNAAVLSWHVTGASQAVIEPGVGIVSAEGSLTVRPPVSTTYRLTAIGPTGISSAVARVVVEGAVSTLPEGSFGKSYQSFVPLDATLLAYAEEQFSLVTGTVRDLAGAPLAGVAVTVHGRPELGTATTDGAGVFVLPVEGGTTLTLAMGKSGFLGIHRSVTVGWNDFVEAETAVLIAEDPVATPVVLDGDPRSAFVHRGSLTRDESGTRTAAVIISGDTVAYAVTEAGEMAMTAFELRATEYPVAEAMPARLPPASAYTYCVDIGASGVENVRFSKPVAILVDNFLGFPVGEAVPAGYYDFREARWVPSENGRVVALLDMDGDGTTDALDATGDLLPDDLNGDGSVADEAFGLADKANFPPGASFWRTMVTHLSPWDFNWPWGFPDDAREPNPLGPPLADQKRDSDPLQCTNSYVERLGRVYNEDLPIAGTNLNLHYASDRVPGCKTVIHVPASGHIVPASLDRIVVRVRIAGQTLETVLSAGPDRIATFAWDGRDALGLPVSGVWRASAEIGFVYRLVLRSSPQAFSRSFGSVGSSIGQVRSRIEGISWKRIDFEVDRLAHVNDIAEGWTVSAHHQLLPFDPTRLYKGDGSTIDQDAQGLATWAGTYGWDANGSNGACGALCYPMGIAGDRAGNLYVGDVRHNRVVRVSPAGAISAFAGQSDWSGGFGGDGGPAISARLKSPGAIAVDPGGNVFILDRGNARIRKVDARGVITTVAGNGVIGFSPDNTPAVEARLGIGPVTGNEIAVDPWGNLYIAEYWNQRVRKVGPDGLLVTVAGTGVQGSAGNGLALGTNLDGPWGVAADAKGNLYVTESAAGYGNRPGVKLVTPDGRIARVAGGGTSTAGAGIPALQARLDKVTALLPDEGGNLYFIDRTNGVCRIDPGGNLNAVPGGWQPAGLAMDPKGALYVLGSTTQIVQKLTTPAMDQSLVAIGDLLFADEGLGHVFSATGRHLATVDLETRAVLRSFGYRDGRLTAITDPHGNVTEIVRGADGEAIAIVAPGGPRTELAVGGGVLTRVRYPDGGSYVMGYSGDGLMIAQQDPNGNHFSHAFDFAGRLLRVEDPAGGDWKWDRYIEASGVLATAISSAEGDVSSYRETLTWGGASDTEAISPDGSQSTTYRSADDLTETTESGCGTKVTTGFALDPLWKYKYASTVTETIPSGRARSRSVSRAYRDTNGDKMADAVTESLVMNGRTATRVNNTLAGEAILTSASGRSVAMKYDPVLSLVSEVAVPGMWPLQYRYDARGRVTDIETGQRSTRLHYDGGGNLDSIVAADGRTYAYTFDDMGRLQSENRAGGISLQYQYDPNGNLTVLTNPNAVTFSFDYTANNQRLAMTPPLSGAYRYLYDRDRRLTDVVLPSGRTITSIYAEGTLIASVTPEGRTDYEHLCGGRLARAVREGEVVALSYDGPLVTADTRSGTLSQTVGYTFNNDFAVSSVSYAGATVSLGYDADGLLTQSGSYAISRDARNGLALGISGNGLTVGRAFNGYGELDGQSWTVAGRAAYDLAVTRDLAGRVASRSETVDGATVGWSYRYDDAGRLTEVERDGVLVEAYSYDPNGNRVTEMNALRGIAGRGYSHSAEDHTLTAGSDNFVFDADGYLQSSTTTRGTTRFEYSSRGELLRADLPSGMIVTYIHDPFGRRIAKEVNGAVVEKYLWADRTALLAVYDGSDNLLQRYSYADGRVPVSMTAGGATYFLLTDQVGSLRAVVDSSGAVVKRIDYDSFGNILADSNPAFAVPFGFAGGLHDRDTGLVRFGYRDYSPELGRFTAKDPIDFAGGDTNLYAYAMNDPVNFVDPIGLWGEDVHGGMTYSWALSLGLTPDQAERIARADNGTDGGFGSWMPLLGDQSRHFGQSGGSCDSRSAWAETEYQRAVDYYGAGNLAAALGHLGRGLHSLQDIDPHRDWDTGASGTGRHPDWYDSWSDPRNSAARVGTEQKTLEYLRRFLSAASGLR